MPAPPGALLLFNVRKSRVGEDSDAAGCLEVAQAGQLRREMHLKMEHVVAPNAPVLTIAGAGPRINDVH
jgi:hypothetical protein